MKKQHKSILTLGIIMTFIATAVFLPKLIGAGELEPSHPPGPTMKTLDQIPPTWSQKLDVSERFELVMDGEAVLDKETGLVWERSPDTTTRDWAIACGVCYGKEVSNRRGWRLPTIEELSSLVDNDNSNPALPTNHPFSNVQWSFYWSSTTTPLYTDRAWVVGFDLGGMGGYNKSENLPVWCVRGGHGYDRY